jgi:hypothetical protein
MIVVEMNPRVSRSRPWPPRPPAFPIAKIAAKLAVGYTLDEIPNDITGETLASFEPTLDYCVVKIPRWTFEKFPETPDLLTTAMKSVGETMAIGRTFKEAFQKGLRSWRSAASASGPTARTGRRRCAAHPGRDRTEAGHPQLPADLLPAPCPSGGHVHRDDPRDDRHRSLVSLPAGADLRWSRT